ncbi:MAG TPA: peroxiredoxin [Candidatus Thermoplasmatota archaeon]|jgi:peroxiredoxin Q/BCP|nr:peroxiredoxin [Candidatus Thermoplasmatota archaeon]
MVLSRGDPAPDIEAPDQHGQVVKLRDLRGRWVVLFFYPADDTPGCTAEACGFRDDARAWEQAGAVVVGVSTQGVASHQAFASKHGLDFTLLADTDKRVGKALDALNLLGYAKRVTYLIDPQGTIARVWPHVSPRHHSQEVLAALAELRAKPA